MPSLLLCLLLLAPGDVVSSQATCTYSDAGGQAYTASAACQFVVVSRAYRPTPVFVAGPANHGADGMLVRRLTLKNNVPEPLDGIQLSNGSLWMNGTIWPSNTFWR